MDNRITLEELIEILTFRTYIIFLDDEDLAEHFEDDYDYIKALRTISNLLSFEDGIFAIINDTVTDRIYRVINIKRWEIIKKYPELNDYINSIIMKINILDKMSEEEKDEEREIYFDYLEDIKSLEFDNYLEYLESFAIDVVTLNIINGEELDKEYDINLIIGSLNYLVELVPDLFKIKGVRKRLNELLDEIRKSTNNPIIINNTHEIRKVLTKE